MSDAQTASILHVDDRDENRYVVSKILRNAGFEVIEGKTGREALELALHLPDLIILDVRLPDIMGYEISKRIKSNPMTSAIPIIQLSASFVTNESKVQALDSGADQYLTQPVEPPVLVASVKALLRMRKAEALSRLSARQWQTTFDALSEGIGLLDANQSILRCNRAMSELLELKYSQIEGRNCPGLLADKFGVGSESFPTFSARQTVECQVGMRWYRITIDPVLSEANVLTGSILVIAEITAQRRAEEALKVTEKLAAVGRLAHSIAHEINNPLEAVTNIVYILQQVLQENEEARHLLAVADRELNRVSHITKQTLTFHRDTSSPVPVNVSELVDNVVDLYRSQTIAKDISMEKRYESTQSVNAFPAQLQQVFSNLIANAIDASSPRGTITLHVYDSQLWNGHSTPGVRVAICDRGKGIPSADLKRIFEAFYTTKEQKGSGLGLWLSLGIVQKHSGEIRVRSSVRNGDSGTCFSTFLPVNPRL